jgi:hypothetical protein
MCQKNCCHSELLISAVKRIALAFSLIALLFAIGPPADPQMKIISSITTYAGNGIAVDPGDGGPAISAGIVNPARAAVDSAGNVYIAEYSGGHRVHKVAAGTGIITTVAGNGVAGFSGDGGAATSAQLNNPNGVIFDSIRRDDSRSRVPLIERNTLLVSARAVCETISSKVRMTNAG